LCGALDGSGTLSLPGIAIWVVQTASNDIYVSFPVSCWVNISCYVISQLLRSFGTLVFSVVCAEPPLTYICSAEVGTAQ
jgi:hypothetical protein